MRKNTRLVKARKEAGLTQEKLAELLECQKSTVSNWENGYSVPRLSDAFRIAEILNKDAKELFFEDLVQDTHTLKVTTA
ncbi:helix-turn-helix transcriptional regulator [Alkalihalobacterium alkalinitrilicum]|uniref:helix-turn-helix transcriptional regulator n=1 Tax=Alkalihalobacterium alkalinitrilicum TaxID=427920 RepID=UPI0009956A0D|nr:helix-turn-helix transcriptional regulator [Alkalihalobacterium alkalinitrilicum]